MARGWLPGYYRHSEIVVLTMQVDLQGQQFEQIEAHLDRATAEKRLEYLKNNNPLGMRIEAHTILPARHFILK